jgi:hypothetical protein
MGTENQNLPESEKKETPSLLTGMFVALATALFTFLFTSLHSYYEKKETHYKAQLQLIVSFSKSISSQIEYMRDMDRFHIKFDKKYLSDNKQLDNQEKVSAYYKSPYAVDPKKSEDFTDSLSKSKSELFRLYKIAKDSIPRVNGVLQSAAGIFTDTNTLTAVDSMTNILKASYYQDIVKGDIKKKGLTHIKENYFEGWLDDTLLHVRLRQLDTTINSMRREIQKSQKY